DGIRDRTVTGVQTCALPIYLNYMLGVINSRLMSWYFLRHSNVAQRDDFPKIVLKETRSLPIRPIDQSDDADKSRHDQTVKLVERSEERRVGKEDRRRWEEGE